MVVEHIQGFSRATKRHSKFDLKYVLIIPPLSMNIEYCINSDLILSTFIELNSWYLIYIWHSLILFHESLLSDLTDSSDYFMKV